MFSITALLATIASSHLCQDSRVSSEKDDVTVLQQHWISCRARYRVTCLDETHMPVAFIAAPILCIFRQGETQNKGRDCGL